MKWLIIPTILALAMGCTVERYCRSVGASGPHSEECIELRQDQTFIHRTEFWHGGIQGLEAGIWYSRGDALILASCGKRDTFLKENKSLKPIFRKGRVEGFPVFK